MHRFYLTLLIALVGLVLLFIFQNTDTTSVRFLTASVTMPRALLLFLVYLLGMLTGGFVVSLVRSWLKRSRKRRAGATSPDSRPDEQGQAR